MFFDDLDLTSGGTSLQVNPVAIPEHVALTLIRWASMLVRSTNNVVV